MSKYISPGPPGSPNLGYREIQSDALKPSLTPLEALQKHPGDTNARWSTYGWPFCGLVVGALAAVAENRQSAKPNFSNLPKFLVYMGFAASLTVVMKKWSVAKQAEEEAMAVEYINLHPEDFPPFERKQFKDIFGSWTPIR